MTASYSLPDPLEPDLARLHAYWKDLIRGENSMPFSDDIDIAGLSALANRIVLLQAFDDPRRFRFEHAGESVAARAGAHLQGAFVDEVGQQPPLEGLMEQCVATVGSRAPTYYRSPATGREESYARLLLPTWGDGRVGLLLGAVVPLSGKAS
ncbi:hypothetical protein [Microvirga thermotolerans]|uniref:PAS domain-containing protein n=1 Tax=Microvirga thermotolerans TaxID=2651334 RepID=A0A5P9JZG0_9HYPH|nr:hypothetical protein [Microvirga thermotolerans]QFU17541.1 hypothetical protein GDR74_15710 [Microvirga thermotolerans]